MVRFGSLAASHSIPERKISNIPIVFVHGAWGGKYQFTNWMRFAAHAGWQSYAIDLRGHDESPCDDFRNASVRDYAEDIENVARALGGCHVVAHSLGGLALQLAASRSTFIETAVFVASAPAGMSGHAKYGTRVLAYLGDLLLGKPIILKRDDALRFLFGYSHAADGFDFTIAESPRAILDRGLGRVRVKELLCPSLVIAAKDDWAIPLSAQRTIVKRYGSDYIEIPRGGHMMMLEEGWERPIEEILRWLRR